MSECSFDELLEKLNENNINVISINNLDSKEQNELRIALYYMIMHKTISYDSMKPAYSKLVDVIMDNYSKLDVNIELYDMDKQYIKRLSTNIRYDCDNSNVNNSNLVNTVIKMAVITRITDDIKKATDESIKNVNECLDNTYYHNNYYVHDYVNMMITVVSDIIKGLNDGLTYEFLIEKAAANMNAYYDDLIVKIKESDNYRSMGQVHISRYEMEADN